jgi:spermidine synthase
VQVSVVPKSPAPAEEQADHFADRNGVPMLQPAEFISSVKKFCALFAEGACYVAAIPTYIGGHMAMGWATDNTRLRQTPVATIAQRYRKAGSFATKYWTPQVHKAAFALPRFIEDTVAKAKASR